MGRLLNVLTRALELLSAAGLATLMTVVFIDVAGRGLFNKPLPWGTELLEIVLAASVFFMYPLLGLRSNHITVDLITFGPGVRRLQKRLACLVGAAVFAILALCLGRQAQRSASYGDASPLLQVPTADVLWAMCAFSVLTALAALVALGRVNEPAPAAPRVAE